MMDIKLIRKIFTENSTIGELEFGDFKCFTLEDVDRELTQADSVQLIEQVKVQNETAIPTGRYEVVVNFSNRFKKLMPLLLGVKGFSGVRIHSGNNKDHTEGCILLGKTHSKDEVWQSRQAILEFMNVLNKKLELGKVYIDITKA